jgi:ubiquinone/menaquinone biosynthesis C-methylase UbiE
MHEKSLKNLVKREFPWGTLFAERKNFEYGYFIAEGRLVKKYLKNGNNKRILVIGSGNGREARPICHNCRIVCLDIGRIYLKVAVRLFETEDVQNISFVQADMKKLPFADNSFDFVFFSLYNILGKYRFDVLRKVHSILRTEGLVLLGTHTDLYKTLYRNTMAHNTEFKNWVLISNKEQLNREISSCSFELIEDEIDPLRPEYRFTMLRSIK